MEKPTVEVASLEVKVIITFNPATSLYDVKGVDENPIVAWGMLEYVLSRLRRAMAQHDLGEQMESASKIVLGTQVPH